MYRWGALASRLSGGEFLATAKKPATFYWFGLAHACVLLLPLAGTGVAAAAARLGDPARRALLAWFLGILVISAFAVKSGVYGYALLPAWAAMAALGAAELRARGLVPPALGGLVLTGLAAPGLARGSGQPGLPIVVWLGVIVFALALAGALRLRPGRAGVIVTIAALLLVAAGTWRVRQRLTPRYHDVGYPAVAVRLAPALAAVDPREIAFVSVEAPTLMAYLFRRGLYWYSPAMAWDDEHRRRAEASGLPAAFVVDPRGELLGGAPDSATYAWIESRCEDVSAGLVTRAGAPSPLRVYVRRDAP
jgi:hypothetical protein